MNLSSFGKQNAESMLAGYVHHLPSITFNNYIREKQGILIQTSFHIDMYHGHWYWASRPAIWSFPNRSHYLKFKGSKKNKHLGKAKYYIPWLFKIQISMSQALENVKETPYQFYHFPNFFDQTILFYVP